MIEPKDYVLGAGVLVTLIIGIWNAIANWRLSRRTAFINTVTSERVKWLSSLRENISTFCGLTYTWRFSQPASISEEKEREIHLQIDKLRHLIRLQLNPIGEYDKAIEELINQIPNLAIPPLQSAHDEQNADALKKALNDLIEVSQKLLKNEWEKVKEETKRGDLNDNTEHCFAFLFRRLHEICLKTTSHWRQLD